MQRKLTAILSADVKGYSRLMGDDEVATIHTLTAYREVLTRTIEERRGRVVDAPGDNLLAEFVSVVDAVQGAVEIQKELGERNAALPDERKMEFRIGINLGDVVIEGKRIYGDGVNIAARVEGLAEGGGICISGTVYEHVENKLALSYEFLGEQQVKNIAKPVRVYRVKLEPESGSALSPPAPAATAGAELATPLALPDKPSIAILPFDNMSNDAEQQYFSDGITEDLITDLSKISDLFVIDRHSSFIYKEKAVTARHVARELGVRYVLEGSVRKAGNKVRINAQLIDSTSSYHVWADRYDGDLHDIFALQDEITQTIVAELKVKLTPDEAQRLACNCTSNPQAYDSYLRGIELLRQLTPASLAAAREAFERTTALDPQCAAGYALLGETYWNEWVLFWRHDQQTFDAAYDLEIKALGLDPTLSSAHGILSNLYVWNKQHDLAIAEAQKMLENDPNDADGHAQLAMTLTWVGRAEEAVPLIKRAMRLNPHCPSWYFIMLGCAYFLMGRHDEALGTLQKALRDNPDFVPAHSYLAIVYAELDRLDEARAEVAICRRLSPQVSVENLRQFFPYKDAAVLERHLSALHKAGLE